MKLLRDVISAIDPLEIWGELDDRTIDQIHYDSRRIKKDTLFVAIRGQKVDGHQFIEDSVEKGATAIVCEEFPKRLHQQAVYVRVENSRSALAKLAKQFYDNASEKLILIGVTGTNGKTTTASLIHSILSENGIKSGLIGTIAVHLGDSIIEADRTTPEALELHSFFDKMVNAGCRACVMEVSSHALYLHRVEGIRFNVAVFTNLTRDHLDFHGSMENYFQAKKILFDSLHETAVAVTNLDDLYGKEIIADSKATVRFYAVADDDNIKTQKQADVVAKVQSFQLFGTSVMLSSEGKEYPHAFKVIGKFNLYNVLAAYLTGLALKLDHEQIIRGISHCKGVAGRMEQIWSSDHRCAIVDYAHTPDALLNVIRALKEVISNEAKLITLFGCGGDRDKGKRALMGEIASRESHVVIMTSDNPRTENPESILDDIESGISPNTALYRIADREMAIRKGISLLGFGDVLLVAGKGHESYQEINGVKYPFDDREVIQKIFSEEHHD